MGCWGITAFESDSGLDAVETIRHALPKDGNLELAAAIEALREHDGDLPDVKLAHSHSGPIAVADIVAKFVDGDISRLDYDDEAWEQDGKFKEIRTFTAAKETLAWLRAYVADTLKIRVAAAAESAKSGCPTDEHFRADWGGWVEERDWLDWQKYLQSLITTLDNLLGEPGESVQIKKCGVFMGNTSKAEAVARLEDIITSHGYDFERDMEGLTLVRVYNFDYHFEVQVSITEDVGRYSGTSTALSARLSFSASAPDEECLGAAFHEIRLMARLVGAINNPVITYTTEK